MGGPGVESVQTMGSRQLGGEKGEMIARFIAVVERWRCGGEPGEV
jgi:hypothetical protein